MNVAEVVISYVNILKRTGQDVCHAQNTVNIGLIRNENRRLENNECS